MNNLKFKFISTQDKVHFMRKYEKKKRRLNRYKPVFIEEEKMTTEKMNDLFSGITATGDVSNARSAGMPDPTDRLFYYSAGFCGTSGSCEPEPWQRKRVKRPWE